MSSIQNIGGTNPIHNLSKAHSRPAAAPVDGASSQPARGTDQVSLSGGEATSRTRPTAAPIRSDKVAIIKSQIAAGAYESEQKLDMAVDRLLDAVLK